MTTYTFTPIPTKVVPGMIQHDEDEPFTVTTDDNDVIKTVDGDESAKRRAMMFAKSEHHGPEVQWMVRSYSRTHLITKDDDDVTKDDGGSFEIAKFDVDKQLVFGWAYVTHDVQGNVVVDKSGEFIDDPDELEEAAYLYVQKSRVGGDSHTRITSEIGTDGDTAKKVGTMVESMVFTPEKLSKMGLPPGILPTGWWVGFKVEDPEVWKAVKEGKRPAFSIHGSGRREEVK